MCGKQFETERMLHTHQQWCDQLARQTHGKQVIKVQTAADKEKKRKQEAEADRIRRGAVVNMEALIKGAT